MATMLEAAAKDLAERREELKRIKRKLERAFKETQESLEDLENKTYLSFEYTRPASDTRGRKAEIQTSLRDNRQWRLLSEEVKDLKDKLEDTEDLISSINFRQRNRLIITLSTLDEKLNGFTETVDKFTQAVDRFSQVRK